MGRKAGRHFLQIPGPTNVPERILRAIDRAVLDHRGPTFQAMSKQLLEDIKPIFKTKQPVVIFPASGTGGWEAALANTLSPGDHVLLYETGQFAMLWKKMADGLQLKTELIESDWRRGADPDAIAARLSADKDHEIKAVCVVHSETSTGCASRIAAVRKAIDATGHPALLMVDTVSSLGSMDYRHDEWGVDVSVGGSQKGLMLPAGLAFNAISDKALKASETSTMPKGFFRWSDMLAMNKDGFYPYTPATNMLYGLRVAIDMLNEEGLDNVFARHERHAEATRRAVRAWGLEILCAVPEEASASCTAVLMPEGSGADRLRKIILDAYDMSLGAGLGKVADKVFRIGHLGDFNDLTLMGTLSGIEMGLKLAGVKHTSGGAQAALEYLTEAQAGGEAQRTAAQ